MRALADADRIRQLGDLSHDMITVSGNIKFDIDDRVDPIQKNVLGHLLNFSPPRDTVLTFSMS